MAGKLKVVLLTAIIILGIIALLYYNLMQIDFIGNKDPKVVEENVKRWNNTLLSAEYRNGTDYCKVELLDSVNIEINVGDKAGGVILHEKYSISNDTIIVNGNIKHADKYLDTDKFLIQNNKLLFKIDKAGSFDTTIAMTMQFNKLK